MELKDYKCLGCNTLRKKSDFIYKEKVNKTCSKCYDTRLKNKEKDAERTKKYQSQNKEKVSEQRKKYYNKNKERIIEHQTQYREQNKEQIAEYRKQHCEQNKDKIAEQQKQYREQNKEQIAEQQKQYNEQNKDKIAERQKQYYKQKKQDNPLEVKIKSMIQNSNKSDKKYNRTYDKVDYIDYDFLLGLWESQHGLCVYESCKCEMVLTFRLDTKNPQQITIQRLDNEIAHIKSNCVLSCFFCNCMKKMEQYDL